MKNYIRIVIVSIGLLINYNGYAVDISSDDFIIDAIKKESNLTSSDLSRWNFLWLGPSSLTKVEKYAHACAQFPIANTTFVTMYELQESMKSQHNAIWSAGTCIAQDKGCDNLLAQATVALLLLENIGRKKIVIKDLYDRIIRYKSNIQVNKKLLQECVNKEKAERAFTQGLGIMKYAGGLFLASAAAAVTYQHIKNIQKMWSMFKDVSKTGVKAYEWWNKPGIITPPVPEK